MADEKSCFVVMAFGHDDDDDEHRYYKGRYQEGVEPAITQAGLKA